jgi:outer membrane protein OmpA-like peptidoglycan-associated protein
MRGRALLALAAALALGGSGGTAAGALLPAIGGLDPSQAPAGTPGLTLRVLGTGLLPGSVVCWRGAPRPTVAAGLTELRAELSAADLGAAGGAAVTVALPSALAPATCGLGSLLGPLTFTVSAAPPVGDPAPAPAPPAPAPPAPAPPTPAPPTPAPPAGKPPPALVPQLPLGAVGAAPTGVLAGLPGAAAAGVAAVSGLLHVDGLPGELLTVAGTGLGVHAGRVLIRGRPAPVVSWSPTRAVVLVRPLPNQPPVPNPVALPAPGGGFVFDATLSVDPEGLGPAPGEQAEHGIAAGIRSVLWNFGDGSTSTAPVAAKTYRRPGTYHVTLRVTDADGRSATAGQTVTAAATSGAARSRPTNIRIPSQILFDVGAYRLRPESRAYLRRVAKVTRRATGAMRVAGHTDTTGPARFNLILSGDRAHVVRSYLVGRAGVPARRIGAVAYGESRPLAPNDTPLGRQLNRRVVIRLRLPSVGLARI